LEVPREPHHGICSHAHTRPKSIATFSIAYASLNQNDHAVLDVRARDGKVEAILERRSESLACKEIMVQERVTAIRNRLKAPRAAAIAGIVFSILLVTSLALIRVSVPATPRDAGTWLSSSGKSIDLALSLLPFAGIAFLWFIGVLRDRMGPQEDRFFATVFLGSGLLFLAMIFASFAVAGGLMTVYGAIPVKLMDSGIYTFARAVAYELGNVYAIRMAGVFMISTCTLAIRIEIFPRWMAFLGYALALLLLLSPGRLYWGPMVFPLWVLVISVYILLANLRHKAA
jgi:hypothetical protein